MLCIATKFVRRLAARGHLRRLQRVPGTSAIAPIATKKVSRPICEEPKGEVESKALFLFVIVVVFLSLAFSSRSNFSIRRRSTGSVAILSIADSAHASPHDKTFHDSLSKAATAPTLPLELDQCGCVYLR